VKRISGSIYPEVRAIAKILAEAVIARTVPITKYNNKKTVSVRHVKEALDSIGIRLYGCEN
jgi:histone H3/H4